ncbi:MAG: EFR1 family ferrodoxin [Candidatus Omnitrophota bacterium]|nr:4Fe-4S ferredoxin [Candidatus Omnitrophota bacterium]MBU2528517.1 EFR1 family ferrodoxin [bacterium]MBU3929889.1 EFR1 family ferrodoxin [bacterium]MBU4122369.1 EFR1 family ferrodoxin [bacterium]
MKTIIYYFSGTGNSLKIACDLALLLADTEFFTDRTEVFSMARAGEADVSADRIGLVFPVYMFGLPLIVSDFVEKLAAADDARLGESDKYIFAVATHGGGPGGALKMLYNKMKKRGLPLDAAFSVAMPGNYTPLYGAPDDDKQKALFEKAGEKVREISARVLSGEREKFEFSNCFINAASSLVHGLMSSRIPGMDKKFYADEKCNACAICEKVCPVENIKMLKGKPSWNHKCQQCMACLQWCPKEAIQYAKATRGRRRYHHPEIKLNEIIQR